MSQLRRKALQPCQDQPYRRQRPWFKNLNEESRLEFNLWYSVCESACAYLCACVGVGRDRLACCVQGDWSESEAVCGGQGFHRNSKTQFHDFSMINDLIPMTI